MYQDLNKSYWWPGMKNDVAKFVLNQVCSSFEESKSFEFDGRLDVLVVVEVL